MSAQTSKAATPRARPRDDEEDAGDGAALDREVAEEAFEPRVWRDDAFAGAV